ncbi:hypothetical protein [Haloarcula sp. JP-L23]|uniref:hypothetical protein n=1 Tax=Haloarcula sp. JP-L23 TaxID=2716717 RepID=UPI00140ECE18|nr:hypothetical protein G9465_06925 [Haloarcula sp. JP-L23]
MSKREPPRVRRSSARRDLPTHLREPVRGPNGETVDATPDPDGEESVEHVPVPEDDVDVADAYPLAKEWMRQAALDSVAFHHHVLYESIREAGTIDSQTLHKRYGAIADDVYAGRQRTSLIKRTRRDTLAKLHGHDLLGQEGGTKDRIYWVLDENVRSGYDIDVRAGAVTSDS